MSMTSSPRRKTLTIVSTAIVAATLGPATAALASSLSVVDGVLQYAAIAGEENGTGIYSDYEPASSTEVPNTAVVYT